VIIRKDATDASAYDEFSPVVLRQHEGKAVVEFESFDKAMDAFFTIVEGRKIEEQKAQQKKAALRFLCAFVCVLHCLRSTLPLSHAMCVPCCVLDASSNSSPP
jgi:hypothetical protein